MQTKTEPRKSDSVGQNAYITRHDGFKNFDNALKAKNCRTNDELSKCIFGSAIKSTGAWIQCLENVKMVHEEKLKTLTKAENRVNMLTFLDDDILVCKSLGCDDERFCDIKLGFGNYLTRSSPDKFIHEKIKLEQSLNLAWSKNHYAEMKTPNAMAKCEKKYHEDPRNGIAETEINVSKSQIFENKSSNAVGTSATMECTTSLERHSIVTDKTAQTHYKGKPTNTLMYLDCDNVLQPVKHFNDIKDVVCNNKTKTLPLPTRTVEDAITRINRIPFDQVIHFAYLGEYVRRLQADGKLCDVSVRIGEHTYVAHQISLACYSDYFANTFYTKSGSHHIPLNVTLKGINPKAFETFLKFIYTGIMDITPDIIGGLIKMAENLMIPIVKILVKKYLEKMPLETALDMLLKEKILEPLYDGASSSVCAKFSSLRFEKYFPKLDIETLINILNNDNLNITTDLDVFKAAIVWIGHDIMHRKQFLLKLMQCVRFTFMTHYELFQCTELSNLLKDNDEFKQMLLEANWQVTSILLGKGDPWNFTIPHRRITSVQHEDMSNSACPFLDILDVRLSTESLFKHMLVGSLETPIQHIIALDVNPRWNIAAVMVKSVRRYKTKWIHWCNIPEPRVYYAFTMLEETLYLTGGMTGSTVKHQTPCRDAFVFDIKSGIWMTIKPMKTARMYHSLVCLYGMVYAVGGQDDCYRVLESVECYNPTTDNWFYVQPMYVGRLGTGTGVLCGKLFVAGGYRESIGQSSGKPVLDSVECFDPISNVWNIKNNLRLCRCYGEMVIVNNKMYLCGGAIRSVTNNDSVITSVSSINVYNEETDVWEYCSGMKVARHGAGATRVGNCIYIFGGESTKMDDILQSVECFDTCSNTWLTGVDDLPYPSKWIRCLSIND